MRIDRETVGDNGVEPLRRGLAAADACGVPVMVHIGTAPPPLDEVLDLLRPGDIVTHCASGIAAPLGPAVHAARDARRAARHRARLRRLRLRRAGTAAGGGAGPDTVSTDLHARSVHGPVFDLPTTMAKLLAVGLPLEEVLAAATIRPARALGLPAATLAVGAPADLAVFRSRRARSRWSTRTARSGTRRCGWSTRRRTWPAAGCTRGCPPPPPWIPLTDAQRAALARRERDLRALLTAPLVGADGLAEQFPRPTSPS